MKFIKKPLPIEAVKCIKENENKIIELLNTGVTSWRPIIDAREIVGFCINSWEGADPVFYDVSRNKNSGGKAYWIIKGLKGEVYPCVADDKNDAPLGYEVCEDEEKTIESFLETRIIKEGSLHDKKICVGLIPMSHWEHKQQKKAEHGVCVVNVFKDIDLKDRCICICAHGDKNGGLEHMGNQKNVLNIFINTEKGEELIKYCKDKNLNEYTIYTHGCYDNSRSTPECVEINGIKIYIRSLTDLGCTSTFCDSVKRINGKDYGVIVFEEVE